MEVGTSQTWELEVQCLTDAVTLPVNASMTCEELRQAIQEHLGIDADHQVWHANGKRLKLYSSQRLEVLTGTSLMTVLRCEPALKPLPQRFALRFTSARRRLVRARFPSRFVIEYRIQADVKQGILLFEPWRKNDHDVMTFDSKNQEVKIEQGHSMLGSTFSTQSMKVDALVELISLWHGDYLEPDQTPFWKAPSESPAAKQVYDDGHYAAIDTHKPQALPDYDALPGWFVAPDEDCQEIEMDLRLSNLFPGAHFLRMLVKNGEPIRVALSGGRVGNRYMGIEEYDVRLKELQPDESLQSNPWQHARAPVGGQGYPAHILQ